jgi:hypothetical protein
VLKELHKGKPLGEISKMIGDEWAVLKSKQEIGLYQAKANMLKEKYYAHKQAHPDLYNAAKKSVVQEQEPQQQQRDEDDKPFMMEAHHRSGSKRIKIVITIDDDNNNQTRPAQNIAIAPVMTNNDIM